MPWHQESCTKNDVKLDNFSFFRIIRSKSRKLYCSYQKALFSLSGITALVPDLKLLKDPAVSQYQDESDAGYAIVLI